MERLELSALPRSMAVAVSGGADSMALALLAAQWARERKLTLFALTVDHGIRTEAAQEAVQVRSWLASYGVDCHILTLSTPLSGSNLQEKAREARYCAMARWCEGQGVAHVLLAHHADDQLETVVMRLVRASGVEGLAGMRAQSTHDGLTLLRPLLGISKTRLIATLEAAGQAWIEDPSNVSGAYTRNRLRPVAEALVREGLSAERITLLTSQLAATADYLRQQKDAWLAEYVRHTEDERVWLPLDAWSRVPREIGWRALRSLIMQVGKRQKPPRSENLMPLFDALAAEELTKPRTLGGCKLCPVREENRLYFAPEGRKI